MPAAPSGAAGFVARHHAAVLAVVASLTGIVTAVTAVLAWQHSASLIDIGLLALSAALAASAGWWQTRQGALALLMALTPLIGLIWAAPLTAGAPFGAGPFLAYGFGFVAAALYAEHRLDRLLRTAVSEPPWLAAAVVLGLAGSLAILWFHATAEADAALQAVGDAVLTTASVALLLPLTVPLIAFDEAFVADANRTHEGRGRFTERLGDAAVPRWALSLSGIVLVFLALGWFGAGAMIRESWWRHGATLVLTAGVLGAVAGGWREGLAVSLIAILAALTGLWWLSYARPAFAAVSALQIAMLASILALAAALRLRAWRLEASRRTLEAAGGALLAAAGAAAAVLPILREPHAVAIVVAFLAAGLGGAVLFPVLLIAIETLLPRRRTVEEVFRHRPPNVP